MSESVLEYTDALFLMTVRIECHAVRDAELAQRYHAQISQQLGMGVQVVLDAHTHWPS